MKQLLLVLAVLTIACPVPLIQYYCGYGGDFCGQSNTDDTQASASIIILAFADINTDGKVVIDEPNHPSALVSKWQSQGKKVLLSIGGANAMWAYLFATPEAINLGTASIADLVTRFSLDGIDLDIEYYNTDPTVVASWIHTLKGAIGGKFLTIAPECVGVYTGSSYTPGVWNSWNYWVPVINTAINDIDLVMVQAYNNWYEQPAGTLAFVKDVYVNWMNKPQKDLCNWCTPIPDFTGVPESKLVIGLIASTSAGNAGYYLPPLIIQQFIGWAKTANYSLAGIMFWDSHWDSLNGYASSNAVVQASLQENNQQTHLSHE